MGHPTAIFLTPPDPNYKCAICLDIMDDPVSLLQCGHTFCRSCLASSLSQSGKSCPECRAAIDVDGKSAGGSKKDKRKNAIEKMGNVIHSVRVIQCAIGNCMVRCKNAFQLDNDEDDFHPKLHPNRSCQSCNWTGPLSSWPTHASRSCPIEVLTCPIMGCGHTCPRHEMKSHIGSAKCIQSAIDFRMEKEISSRLKEMLEEQIRLENQVRELNEEGWRMEELLDIEKEHQRMLEKENESLRLQVENWAKQSKMQAGRRQAEKQVVIKLRREKEELEALVKRETEQRRSLEEVIETLGKRLHVLKRKVEVAKTTKKAGKLQKKRSYSSLDSLDLPIVTHSANSNGLADATSDAGISEAIGEKKRAKKNKKAKKEERKRARTVSTDMADTDS